ncbi:MAG: carbamoyltransferase HypF [bacterium]
MDHKENARIFVRGIVQGVGFRPFIYNLANSLRLTGWIANTSKGVVMEIEGGGESINKFLRELRENHPPLAAIEGLDVSPGQIKGYEEFSIRGSLLEEEKLALISPDVATCDLCFADFTDPSNRRYNYPFTNCTNCGPRYTIIEEIPYDRERTTMRHFEMCPQCAEEYRSPTNRRFHAEPNACPICGPKLSLLNRRGEAIGGANPLEETVRLLKEGEILAVKGLGGFHLACDASNDRSVRLLRERKKRPHKPFALMAPSPEAIEEFCELNDAEREILRSHQAPIVLLRKRTPSQISPSVAPDNRYLGVMLPYTPLHHLIFQGGFLALVMTSANLQDEPIVADNREALSKLKRLADFFLVHNREIYNRTDDSVLSVVEKKVYMIRRSRGFAPEPLNLDFDVLPTLACGAELKNTFCLAQGRYAFLGPHIGDLNNLEALRFFEETIERYKRYFSIDPQIVSYDLHPDYLSTRYARNLDGKITKIPVQHHHAHIASCLAENSIRDHAIGVAFDGVGWGGDGSIWGGEFLIANCKEFINCGHIERVPMPGGDAATRRPARMALSYLHTHFGEDRAMWKELLPSLSEGEMRVILRQIERGINSPLTSSVGRLFDTVSSLLGLVDLVTFEGQAAIALEMVADPSEDGRYEYDLYDDGKGIVVGFRPLFRGVLDDISLGVSKGRISARFHNALADVIAEVSSSLRDRYSVSLVALSGGVFQNRCLLERTLPLLRDRGFRVLIHSRVPCNDGGIALGQMVVANEVYR